MKPTNIDAEIENADWIKLSWPAATTLAEYAEQAGLSEPAAKERLRHLLTLPVGRSMPAGLVAELA